MNHMTIGEVSSIFQVSTRMLRYYEKMGLIESTRKEGYAYRVYDENTVKRIQQIIILRKLQIPLKQIRCILNGDREKTIQILKTQINGMDESVKSIQTIKEVLEKLLELFYKDTTNKNCLDGVQENSVMKLLEFLPLERYCLKEKQKMSVRKEMVEKQSCVRIVMLPPCTVAAYQFVGDNPPEETVGEVMNTFVRSSKLYEKKPDARLFGFDNPNPAPGDDYHGYEDWVTISDDMEVPKPLVKKHFEGGIYAAYTINFPDFYEWNFLTEWVKNNDTWQANYHKEKANSMDGCLEEHLNWVYSSHMGWSENSGVDGKLDLLLPIKLK